MSRPATPKIPFGARVLFLLNHGAEAVEVVDQAAGTDLLSGPRIEAGDAVKIEARGVMVLRELREGE